MIKRMRVYIYHNCQKFSLEESIKYFEERKVFEKIKSQCISEKMEKREKLGKLIIKLSEENIKTAENKLINLL